jgi:hypothetical protein
MPISFLINYSQHKKNTANNKNKKNIKHFVLAQQSTIHTIKWDHTDCLTLYAPYCGCTYISLLLTVLNWAILGTDKHTKLCII